MNSISRAKLKGIVFPPSGEASIAVGYTPAAVPGRSPDPLWAARRPKDREKKCMFTTCRDYDTVDKENGRLTEGRENRPLLPL